jgi:hypothetical protein
MYKLSPSALTLFEECPRCFWLHHNAKIKRPETPFPTLPSGMDRILKQHFDRFMKKNKLPPELCKKEECKGMKLFQDSSLLDIWRNNLKGISWTDEKGNILHGAVDNLLVKGKKLVVLDYKTRGYPLKEDTCERYQKQLDIYCFLLKKNSYDVENFGFLLFYMPREVLESGEVIFDTELVKMKTEPENGEKLWKKALKLLEGKCPEKDEECVWCKLIEASSFGV